MFISVNCFSQWQISNDEKLWALGHPIAAIKIKNVYKQATIIYRQKTIAAALDNFSNGGKLDAFRHYFYMAAFAQKVKATKLRKLGEAHEKHNYKQFLKSQLEEGEVPDSLSSVMDLKNNELGFKMGESNKKTDLETLKKSVIEKIKAGDAFIMNRNKKGDYLDCDNKIYLLNAKEKKWRLPKCLVSSATIYND